MQDHIRHFCKITIVILAQIMSRVGKLNALLDLITVSLVI